MADERPVELKRYRIQLEGNRGETVMKLREDDLERYNVIGLADGEDAPVAAESEEDQPRTKAKRPANKARTADDK